jgi:hypothetical protein
MYTPANEVRGYTVLHSSVRLWVRSTIENDDTYGQYDWRIFHFRNSTYFLASRWPSISCPLCNSLTLQDFFVKFAWVMYQVTKVCREVDSVRSNCAFCHQEAKTQNTKTGITSLMIDEILPNCYGRLVRQGCTIYHNIFSFDLFSVLFFFSVLLGVLCENAPIFCVRSITL